MRQRGRNLERVRNVDEASLSLEMNLAGIMWRIGAVRTKVLSTSV